VEIVQPLDIFRDNGGLASETSAGNLLTSVDLIQYRHQEGKKNSTAFLANTAESTWGASQWD